jgi:hypothetical protein
MQRSAEIVESPAISHLPLRRRAIASVHGGPPHPSPADRRAKADGAPARPERDRAMGQATGARDPAAASGAGFSWRSARKRHRRRHAKTLISALETSSAATADRYSQEWSREYRTAISPGRPLRFSPTPQQARRLPSACQELEHGRNRVPKPSRPGCRWRCDESGPRSSAPRCARDP